MPGQRRAPRIGQPRLVRGQRRARSSTSARSERRSSRRATPSPRPSAPRASPPALDAAFADDVLFLSPRVNVLSGRAAAGTLPHERPAGAQRAPVERRDRRGIQRRHPGLHLERGILDLRLRHRRARAAELLPDLLAPRGGGRGLDGGRPGRQHRRSLDGRDPRRLRHPRHQAPPQLPQHRCDRAAGRDPERRRGLLGHLGGAGQRAGVRAVRRAQRRSASAAGNTSSGPRPSARRSPASRPT